MLFAFFGLGPQEILLLLLVGWMFLAPALIALAILVFLPAHEHTRTQSAIIRNCVRAIAAVGIWVAVGLVLWIIWSLFANEWWTLIAYFAVGAIAGVFTIKLWPTKPASGTH